MAKFSYENYAAQQQARNTNSASNGGNGVTVHFMGEYLKEDGDVAVVRFPYRSMDDISFETTHSVTFPGKMYPSRVRCSGDGCQFCKEGVKLDIRFFVKALVYVVGSDGNVASINAVWDRPSAFADIDIKNLIQEYGDLSQQLFKIKRNGKGTSTRYTISIIMNNTVYNPEIYKADFKELETVDATRILSKSAAQYNAAINPAAANTAQTPNNTDAQNDSQPASVSTSTAYSAPAATTIPQASTTAQPTATEIASEPRRQTRYQF